MATDLSKSASPSERPAKPGAWDRYWESLDVDSREKLAPSVPCLRSWFAIAEVWAQPSAALPEGAEPTTCPEPSEDYELGRHEGILFAVDEFLADDDETYTQVAQRLMLLVENEAAKRKSELPSPGAQPPSNFAQPPEKYPLPWRIGAYADWFTNVIAANSHMVCSLQFSEHKQLAEFIAERTSAVAAGTSDAPKKKTLPLTCVNCGAVGRDPTYTFPCGDSYCWHCEDNRGRHDDCEKCNPSSTDGTIPTRAAAPVEVPRNDIEKVVGAEELLLLADEAEKVHATRYAEAYRLVAMRLKELSGVRAASGNPSKGHQD